MPRPAFRTLEALRPAGVLPTCAQAALAPWGALSAPSFVLSSGFISREMFCLVSLVWSRFLFYRVLIGHVVSFMAPPATPRPLQWRHRLPSYLWHFLSPAQWLSCLRCLRYVCWMKGWPSLLLRVWHFQISSFLRTDTCLVCGSVLGVSHSPWHRRHSANVQPISS